MMIRHKRILALTAAAVLAACPPVTSLADNPEFAYDEATWARLKDNVMEYDELPMLVEEYNPTYLNNQTSYRDNRTRDNARARTTTRTPWWSPLTWARWPGPGPLPRS